MRQKVRGIFYAFFLLVITSCANSRSIYQNPLLITHSTTGFVPQWEWFSPGVEIARGRIANPKLIFYALRVDLNDDRVRIVANNSEAARGSIKSIKVKNFARLSDCIAAINAGPFAPVSRKEGDDQKIIGLFIRDSIVLSTPVTHYGAILFRKEGGAEIVRQSEIKVWRNIVNAVGGFDIILKESIIPDDILARKERHPRTAVALADGGRTLIFLVIDGRQFSSGGATEAETAEILFALGAEDGLNLDGGGSSTLVLKNGGSYKVVNTPVNYLIAGMERAVATCIGIVEVSESPDD
jgi:exopolysaccharide biosynthesis protein